MTVICFKRFAFQQPKQSLNKSIFRLFNNHCPRHGTKTPLLVATAIFPYLFHLIMHLIFVFNRRTYVPGAITAIIELPITIIYLYSLITLTKTSLWEWIIVMIIMFVLFISNLKFIHWIMAEAMNKLR
ncbi:HXXEE domain-containing protein [Liquorilactobacillus ghanensis]|nr:HXXEE domain-containing protein [Liquorilactobacillus ghanensis]